MAHPICHWFIPEGYQPLAGGKRTPPPVARCNTNSDSGGVVAIGHLQPHLPLDARVRNASRRHCDPFGVGIPLRFGTGGGVAGAPQPPANGWYPSGMGPHLSYLRPGRIMARIPQADPAYLPCRDVALLAALLICKVTFSILMGYGDYFPPNFGADFLLGREKYFWGAYACAFYVHIAAGPASLLLGTLLIVEQFRRVAPAWHRRLGRVQAICILFFVVPSGLWMAGYAATGTVAAAGLGALAIATATCAVMGWRAAVARHWPPSPLDVADVPALVLGGRSSHGGRIGHRFVNSTPYGSIHYRFGRVGSQPLVIFELLVRLSGNGVVVAGD